MFLGIEQGGPTVFFLTFSTSDAIAAVFFQGTQRDKYVQSIIHSPFDVHLLLFLSFKKITSYYKSCFISLISLLATYL